MCGSMADIQSAAAEIRRGKKRRTNHSMKIYMVSLLHRATINKLCTSRNFKKDENGGIVNTFYLILASIR